MNPEQKLDWMKQHGDISQEGCVDSFIHFTWIPKGNPYRFIEGYGNTKAEAYINLFSNIDVALFTLCEK